MQSFACVVHDAKSHRFHRERDIYVVAMSLKISSFRFGGRDSGHIEALWDSGRLLPVRSIDGGLSDSIEASDLSVLAMRALLCMFA